MPGSLYGAPQADPDALDQNAASLPMPQSTRFAEDYGHFDFTNRATHWLLQPGTTEGQPELGDLLAGDTLTPDQANAQYGVEGYKRFNAPITTDEAAWQSSQAHEQQFHDQVMASTKPSPLADFGASLAGSVTDPMGAMLMLATGGLGDAALGAVGLTRAAEAVAAASTVGRVANAAGGVARTLAVGAIDNAPYVAANAALTNYAGEDYTLGDGLRDIAAGAILHTTLHYGGKAISALADRFHPSLDDAPIDRPPPQPFSPDPVPASGVPDAVADLSINARKGAFRLALDDAINDRPVDVAQYIERERAQPNVDRLDEITAAPDLPSFRPLDADTAITPRGAEVPVRYGLAELGDLTTSHTDDLQPNPDYPQELQPRDRSRAGAQARNYQLESELNPKLLMGDVGAGAGAPIVAPDGVVESGNGRLIALRRSAASGGAAYEKYKAELNARGYDATGMQAPALVRMRTQPMTGAARASLARDMNADVTERMSGTEQASADAARISDASFDLIKPNEGPASSRDFARAFISRVAPDQANALTASDGALSPEGARRIKAAVLARAYGDPKLVAQSFEGEETASRQLAEGLAEASPAWAALRAAAARGDIPPGMDLTPALNSAMDLVRHARVEGIGLGDLLAERLGQKDLFGGEAIGPYTEAFLRLMFRDEAMTKSEAPAKIAAALRYYAREAMKVTPGPDLFGETAGETTARQILKNLYERFARNDPGDLDVRPPGRASDAAGRAARDPVVDVRPDGERGDGAGKDLSNDAGPGAGAEGGGSGADGIIAADPDLKELQAETERLAAENGVEMDTAPANMEPANLVKAIRAAAVCLTGELG